MFRKLIETVFYGNYFYGFCTAALSAEASVQQEYPLNSFLYYLFLFSAIVIYYTKAYTGEPPVHTANKRTLWYLNNRKFVRQTQSVFFIVFLASGILLIIQHYKNISQTEVWQYILIGLFPLVALLYYGASFKPLQKFSLRKTGWLKPFIIGFVWAGIVTIYPLLFQQLETGSYYAVSLIGIWFFVKNFMFISVLCIMFDIKDYAADHNVQLKTFVVQVGLRKTIFVVIIPLSIFGFIAYIIFVMANHFPLIRIIFNSIPFFLLIWVAWSLQRRKSILYYLVIIDGLMLVKAFCGILGVLLAK